MAEPSPGIALIVVGIVLMAVGIIFWPFCGLGIVLIIVGIVLVATTRSQPAFYYPPPPLPAPSRLSITPPRPSPRRPSHRPLRARRRRPSLRPHVPSAGPPSCGCRTTVAGIARAAKRTARRDGTRPTRSAEAEALHHIPIEVVDLGLLVAVPAPFPRAGPHPLLRPLANGPILAVDEIPELDRILRVEVRPCDRRRIKVELALDRRSTRRERPRPMNHQEVGMEAEEQVREQDVVVDPPQILLRHPAKRGARRVGAPRR